MLSLVALVSLGVPFDGGSDYTWRLRTRSKVEGLSSGAIQIRRVVWNPPTTAVVVIDMWDDHHCKAAAGRVTEMAPALNETLKAARKRGALIIHAPSDCTNFYKDTPARKRALSAPNVTAPTKFQWNYFEPKREAGLPTRLEEGGCSCDTPAPCAPSSRKWTRQTPLIDIDAEKDAVSADGQEVFNVVKQRQIDAVVLMGVHTNRCVLGRPFGIRQMVKLKDAGELKSVVLCRNLTDSYHRDPGKHFEGLREIIVHVERHWCPTIESTDLGGPKFRFKEDQSP